MNSQANPLPAINPDSQCSILVRGVNWLGDAVMTTPSLQRLRQRFPRARITLLTHEKLGALWQSHPSLDATISFNDSDSAWKLGRRLRAHKFDLAVVLPNSPRSALEAWLARIPVRIGYARPWRNFFLTKAVPSRPDHAPMRKRSATEINQLIHSAPTAPNSVRSASSPAHFNPLNHQIYEYLHLVAALGASPQPIAPLLSVTDTEVKAASARFGLVAPNDPRSSSPIYGLNPGAEYGPAKRWPAERFIAAAVELQRSTNCRWIIFGGPRDRDLASTIAAGIAKGLKNCPAQDLPRNLAGETTLRELCALLRLCRALLTNDSGPMHVAAALGTPVVALFGSTSPELTGPGLPGDPAHAILTARAPCSPCFLRDCPIDFRCLNGISAESVVAAVAGRAVDSPGRPAQRPNPVID